LELVKTCLPLLLLTHRVDKDHICLAVSCWWRFIY